MIVIQTQKIFCFCFTKINTKINTKIALCCTNTAINIIRSINNINIVKQVLYLTLKNYSCDYHCETMNYYQHQKLQHSQQSRYQNSMNLINQILFHSHYIYFYRYFLTILITPHQKRLNVKLISRFFGQSSKLQAMQVFTILTV